MKEKKTKGEKAVEKKARELIKYQEEKTAREKRERAFDEQVRFRTRDVSTGARTLEREVTALSLLFRFLIKKYGAPELTDEEWDKLVEPMRVLSLNRAFGGCPFPSACNSYATCTAQRCNADVCSNGYAYRYS